MKCPLCDNRVKLNYWCRPVEKQDPLYFCSEVCKTVFRDQHYCKMCGYVYMEGIEDHCCEDCAKEIEE